MDPNQAMATRQTQILQRKSGKCLQTMKKIMKNNKEKKRLVPYLNGDIMWHIFNRVPAISVLENCMFLRKQWSNMICSQEFLKAHFIRSRPGMIFLEKVKHKGMDARAMKFVEFEGTKITDVHLLHIFKKEVHILSHCGGLFLVHDASRSKTYVINPITKESIWLPQSTDSLWQVLVSDQACMDYRIVDLSHNREYMLTLFGSDGSCQQINTQNWLGNPVLINGILYCEAEEGSICRVDLSTETFSHFEPPIVDDIITFSEILDVGGSLCFAGYYVEKTIIWILRQQEWVEICRIDSKKQRINRVFGCACKDQLFFAMNDDTVNAYDVKTKQLTMMKPSDNNSVCYGVCVSSIAPLTSKRVS